MSLNEVSPARNDYTSSGGTDYAFTFPIYDQAHVAVYQDGTLKTLNTDYRVRNGASAFSSLPLSELPATGFIQFLNPDATVKTLDNGIMVSLLPDQPVQQQSEYTSEAFPAARLERDFDKAVMISRMLEETLRRCLRARPGENLEMVLPNVASRASNVLGFTSEGLPTAVPLPAAGGDLSLGTVLATGSTEARTLAERFAEAVYASDYATIQDAIDAAPVGGLVLIQPGDYDETLTISKSLHLLGLGHIQRTFETGASSNSAVRLKPSTGTAAITILAPAATLLNGITLEGFEVLPSADGGGTDGILLSSPTGTSIYGVVLERVAVRRFGGTGVKAVGVGTGGIFDVTFRDCNIENWTTSTGPAVDFTDGDPGSLSNQIKLYNCFITSRKAGVFGLKGAPFELYGTIVQDGTIGAHGVDLNGGGIILGGNIEGSAGASTIGVQYRGSVGALIAPGSLSNWGTGVQIGDGTASVAAGAVLWPTISNNVTEDVLLTAGGSRARTTLMNPGSALVVTNDRFDTNGEYELHTMPAATVIATANLPAASATMNNRLVIEETGANTCNLVAYKGGERFKVAMTES